MVKADSPRASLCQTGRVSTDYPEGEAADRLRRPARIVRRARRGRPGTAEQPVSPKAEPEPAPLGLDPADLAGALLADLAEIAGQEDPFEFEMMVSSFCGILDMAQAAALTGALPPDVVPMLVGDLGQVGQQRPGEVRGIEADGAPARRRGLVRPGRGLSGSRPAPGPPHDPRRPVQPVGRLALGEVCAHAASLAQRRPGRIRFDQASTGPENRSARILSDTQRKPSIRRRMRARSDDQSAVGRSTGPRP